MFQGLYRTYSQLSILELQQVFRTIDNGLKPKMIDTVALGATIDGESIYTLKEKDLVLYN